MIPAIYKEHSIGVLCKVHFLKWPKLFYVFLNFFTKVSLSRSVFNSLFVMQKRHVRAHIFAFYDNFRQCFVPINERSMQHAIEQSNVDHRIEQIKNGE